MVIGSPDWAPVLLPKEIGPLAKMLVPRAMPVIVRAILRAAILLPEMICSLSDGAIPFLFGLRENPYIVSVRFKSSFSADMHLAN